MSWWRELFRRSAGVQSAPPAPSTSTFTKAAAGIAVAGWIAATAVFVAPWEGERLVAYRDIVGKPTICFGETKGVKLGDRATHEECTQKLVDSLIEHANGMERCLTRSLPDKMMIAFLSETYNLGVGSFCDSSMRRRANAGDMRGACDALLLYGNTCAGSGATRKCTPVPGLQRRRQAEHKLCLEGLP